MEEYSIEKLTPPAIADILQTLGGGMVQAIIISAEVVDTEGLRRTLVVWDNESSVAIQLGLRDFLSMGMDMRAESVLCSLDDTFEEDTEGDL